MSLRGDPPVNKKPQRFTFSPVSAFRRVDASEAKIQSPASTPPMQYISLGQDLSSARSGLKVSRLGLGCMAMSEFYGPSNEEECIKVIRRAKELGVNFFDTADIYGFGANEELLGKALKGIPREEVVIATKGGIIRKAEDPNARGVSNKAAYIRECVEASLKRLDTTYIDLFYLHRLDSATPIEEAMAVLVELIKEGKIKHIGLSEASPEQISKAHQIYPITAVQTEYSLTTRFVEENKVLQVCRELKIGFVPYSPLGRGLLTGQIKQVNDLEEKDYRRTLPRFQAENLPANLKSLNVVKRLAASKGCTPAQLALAWIFAQGRDMAPIPGTRHIKYLEENIAALKIRLSNEELRQLYYLFRGMKGERYAPAAMELYHLYPSLAPKFDQASIINVFKIILATRAKQGRQLSSSYTSQGSDLKPNSKANQYAEKIAAANPAEINAFFHELLVRQPRKSQRYERYVATAFFEALQDQGIFDLLFPELKKTKAKAEFNYEFLQMIDGLLDDIEHNKLAEALALAGFYSRIFALCGKNQMAMLQNNSLFKTSMSNPKMQKVPEYKPGLQPLPGNNTWRSAPAIYEVFNHIWTYWALKERDFPISISKYKIKMYRDQIAACSAEGMNAYIHGLLTASPFHARKTHALTAINFITGLQVLGIYELLFPELKFPFFRNTMANALKLVESNKIHPDFALDYFYDQLVGANPANAVALQNNNKYLAAHYALRYQPQITMQRYMQTSQEFATHHIMQNLANPAPNANVNALPMPVQELAPQLNYYPLPLVQQQGFLPTGQQFGYASHQQSGANPGYGHFFQGNYVLGQEHSLQPWPEQEGAVRQPQEFGKK